MSTDREKISRQRIIAFLDELIDAFLHDVKGIEFNSSNPRQLYTMCLYGRIFELSVTIKILIKANDHAGLPILLRSHMEAFADFANLIKDEDFLYTMAATFVDQKDRLYNNFSKHPAAAESETRQLDAIDEMTRGYHPQSIRKRFENVGLEATYISAYFILCNYAHNNLAMLEHRQLEKDENGHRVVFFKEEPHSMFVRFAMTLAATAFDAHNSLLSFFNISRSSRINAVCLQFASLREETRELLDED